MYPHQNLDWQIQSLESRVRATPDDVDTRLQLGHHELSKAWFHGGGDANFNNARHHAQTILKTDREHLDAHILVGSAHVGLGPHETALQHLDAASRREPDHARLRFSMGWLHLERGDLPEAIRQLRLAGELAPESWEPQWLLAKAVWTQASEKGRPRHQLASCRAHALQAIKGAPPPALLAEMRYLVGIANLHLGRLQEAERHLKSLLDEPDYKLRVQYYLGLAYHQNGKHENAVAILRQHIQDAGEHAKTHTRLGLAYLALGEQNKAREHCNQAKAMDTNDLEARWALGRCYAQAGHTEEALQELREALAMAPDYHPAFQEMVDIRVRSGHVRWIHNAIRAEVETYDNLDRTAMLGEDGQVLVRGTRAATRQRIATLLAALPMQEANLAQLLHLIDLTTDEGMRFMVWQALLTHLSQENAQSLTAKLLVPGRHYSAALGRETLSVAPHLEVEAVIQGLSLAERDLQSAAVERHGPSSDVGRHRKMLDEEHREARAWQAQLLLSLAAHDLPSTRSLLLRWTQEADADLADAARVALILLGDTHLASDLEARCARRGASHVLEHLLRVVSPEATPLNCRVSPGDSALTCNVCGLRGPHVDHLLSSAETHVCDRCLTKVGQQPEAYAVQDPLAHCQLTGQHEPMARLFRFPNGVTVCWDVVERSGDLLQGLQKPEGTRP